MSKNCIFNNLFKANVFSDLISNKNNKIYNICVDKACICPNKETNKEIIKKLYKFSSNNYRNEYFYKNLLLNKLLVSDDLNKYVALTQVNVGKSKIDFALVGKKAIAFEIKTELDNLERLEKQIADYYKVFNNVCVVTYSENIERLQKLHLNKRIGIYIINKDKIQIVKKPASDFSCINHKSLFKVLNKKEFEHIILFFFKYLPNAKPIDYYDECYDLFCKIPINKLYKYFIRELRNRKNDLNKQFKRIPYELRCMMYFSKNNIDCDKLITYLNSNYGG